MKLISESEYAQLTSAKSVIPLTQNERLFHQKNTHASQVLELKSIPDDIKLVLYNKVVHNLHNELVSLLEKPDKEDKNLSKEQFKATPSYDANSYEEHMLNTFPEKIRNAVTTLIYLLKQHPDIISWDRNGKMSFYKVENDRGANIFDLISYVLRPSLKITSSPPGLKTFVHILEYLNIPTTLFGVKLRKVLNKSNADHLKRRITDFSTIPTPASKRACIEDDTPWTAPPPINESEPKLTWEDFTKSRGVTFRKKRYPVVPQI